MKPAVTVVYERATHVRGTELNVLAAIATFADCDGDRCFPSEALAERARAAARAPPLRAGDPSR